MFDCAIARGRTRAYLPLEHRAQPSITRHASAGQQRQQSLLAALPARRPPASAFLRRPAAAPGTLAGTALALPLALSRVARELHRRAPRLHLARPPHTAESLRGQVGGRERRMAVGGAGATSLLAKLSSAQQPVVCEARWCALSFTTRPARRLTRRARSHTQRRRDVRRSTVLRAHSRGAARGARTALARAPCQD